ncbi:GNAT family N-acetyltransferase [Cellulomonas sp. 179-A 9B4 NHS]|uniref:GNAT family N-acetyltransferase n=1 Tax=Cellulomonas sp. 179-A 9B4 NHS TaxID=3142379 RepID=UPI0039A213EB
MTASGAAARVARLASRKRVVDTAIVLATAPLTAPVALATAVAVRVRLGSPVLFRQERAGLHGRTFAVLKFRSMTNARDASGRLLPDDERLTPFGRLLRRTSLDELPQLLNVLRGDMSLVGPRPLLPRYISHYTAEESRRHHVRPGLTGLAQVSGRNGLGWDERLALDVRYVETASVRGDLLILARTVREAVRGSGVTTTAGHTGEPLDVERSYPVVDGVSLRRFAARDIPTRVRWMNDPATRRHMRLPNEVTEATTQRWFAQAFRDPSRRDWVAYEVATGATVAMLGLRQPEPDALPELYMFVDPGRLGAGLGSRSLRVLLQWVSESRAYAGCTLSTAADNLAAHRLYQRAGFRTVATDPDGRTHMRIDFSVGGTT